MKTIILFFLLAISINAQNKFGVLSILMDDGVSYEAETTSYISRVETDGGTIINATLLNDFVKNAKTNSYYDSLICVIDANFGVKKNANNKVTKIYDLIGDYDYAQSDTSKAPTWVASSQNGLAGLTFDGSNDVMTVTINKVGDAQPYTLFTGFKRIGTANSVNFIDDVSRSTVIGISVTGELFIYAGTIFADNVVLANGTSYLYTGVLEGATSQIWLNGEVKTEGNAGTGIFGRTPTGDEVYYLGASPPETQWTNFTLYNFIAKQGKGNISNVNAFVNNKYSFY